MPNKYLAYCRVSTKAQADRDNSLPTQKRIINGYAERKGYNIVEWYSEAKSGYKGKRGEFYKMIEHLKNPEISGVIFHKLDRSSRNVGDFSVLDRLMTKGKRIAVIEGEFDTSRSAGRLAFRNFCNLCVWYSENLSEEVTTKMAEVLRKGYYPAQTPIGYRRGIKDVDDDWKKKHTDPKVAPFVKECFELMASGNYSIRSLCEYMRKKGMTNSHGGTLRKGVFERMLRNPFYHGLIAWNRKSTKKTAFYEGNHEPLITKALFDRVQHILDGRTTKEKSKHDYTYSKLVKCECGHFLIPSLHKVNIYLECHNKKCDFSSIREDHLEDQIIIQLAKYQLADEFIQYSKEAISRLSGKVRKDYKEKRKALNMKLTQLDNKLEKLNKAVLEGFFDTDEGIAQKNKIVEQKHILRNEISQSEDKNEDALWKLTSEVINLFNYLPYGFKKLNPVIKRKLLVFLFLNRRLEGKKLLTEAVPAFDKLKNANNLLLGQKLLLNQQHKGDSDLKQALPRAAKELVSCNLHNGRGAGT